MKHANDNLPEEIWKDCPSYPGVQASSHGRIRRLPRTGKMPNGSIRIYEGRPTFGCICKSSKDARHLFFIYRYRGIGNIKIHFAVCEAFNGPPPAGKKRVRHLNENGLDNRPGNLVWADQKTNLNDPLIKKFHHTRVSPFDQSGMSKREKRAGIYDSIEDIGHFQLEMRAANENRKLMKSAA